MNARYDITIETSFSAAHRLCGHAGPCARSHGHNWHITATVTCTTLDALGMGIDFSRLKAILEEIIAPLDHRELNQIPPFDRINPTAEHLARHIYQALNSRLTEKEGRVSNVRVEESPGATVVYREVSDDPEGL